MPFFFPATCKLLALPEDAHYYYERVAGMGWMVRRCATGATFDPSICTCKAAGEEVVDESKGSLVKVIYYVCLFNEVSRFRSM